MKAKKPKMTVKEAREYAEACAHLYGGKELPRMSQLPVMIEALAVLHDHVRCVTAQLNATKVRLQKEKEWKREDQQPQH